METLEPFNIQTAEDSLGDTVKPRLMEADADLERVLVIDDTLMLPPCLVPSYRCRPMMNRHRAFFIYRRILNEQYRNQQYHLPDCLKADRQDHIYRPCAFQPDRQRDDGGQNQASAP